jgi:hypothetical protein
MAKEALDCALKAVDYSNGQDADHLAHAYEMLKNNKLEREAESILNRLREIDPHHAAFLEED